MSLGSIYLSNTISQLYVYANSVGNAVDGINQITIRGSGLASGGNALANGNITITVNAASANDVSTGTSTNTAITPSALSNANVSVTTLRFKQAYVSSNTNLNTLTTPGFYQVSSFTNGPSGDSGPGFLTILSDLAGTNVFQLYVNQSTNAEWTRTLSSGSWNSWVQTAKGSGYLLANTAANTYLALSGGTLTGNLVGTTFKGNGTSATNTGFLANSGSDIGTFFLANNALSGYATQTWVSNQGFATQSWVANQNYVGIPWIQSQNYATQDSVNRMGGFRNLFHNPTFAVNQRCVSGTVYLAPGQYGHDGLRAANTPYNSITFYAVVGNPLRVENWIYGTLAQNQPIVFSTDGVLPAPLVAGKVYYVYLNTSTSFYIRNTPGGGQINATGGENGHYWVAVGAGYTFANTYTNSAEKTITIVSGEIQMPVEVNKLIHGSAYVLHHEGTANVALDHSANPNTMYGGLNYTSMYANTSAGSMVAHFSGGTIIRPQFEIGTNMTPFEYRPLTIDQQLCQRYYQKSYSQFVTPGTGTGLPGGSLVSVGTNMSVKFPVLMANSTPLITVYDGAGTAGKIDTYTSGGSWVHGTTPSITKYDETGFSIYAGVNNMCFDYTASAELGMY